MKKNILSFAFLGLFFVWSCRSKEELLPTDPTKGMVTNPNANFLKSIIVEGALEVKVNDSLGTIQVKLPADFLSTTIQGELTFQEGAYSNNVQSLHTSDSIYTVNYSQKRKFKVAYGGSYPLIIDVRRQKDLKYKEYRIYIEHLGKPSIRFLKVGNQISNDFYATFEYEVISGMGTIPNSPNANRNLYKFLLRESGSSGSDTCKINYGLGYATTEFGSLKKYLPLENKRFSIEFLNGNEKQMLSENIQFIRAKPQINEFTQISNIDETPTFYAWGGYFQKSEKYKFVLSNDYVNDIEIIGEVKDFQNLTLKFPVNFPVGNYILSLYENDIQIPHQKMVIVTENSSTKSIRNLLKKPNYDYYEAYIYDPVNIKKGIYQKGDTLRCLSGQYIFPSSGIVDKQEVPQLMLAKLGFMIRLNPSIKKLPWANALTTIYGFDYTIPKSTESGFYEAQLVYPDGRESLKYWNKIEIR